MRKTRALILASTTLLLLGACATAPSSGPMSFFITSAGSVRPGSRAGGRPEQPEEAPPKVGHGMVYYCCYYYCYCYYHYH